MANKKVQKNQQSKVAPKGREEGRRKKAEEEIAQTSRLQFEPFIGTQALRPAGPLKGTIILSEARRSFHVDDNH